MKLSRRLFIKNAPVYGLLPVATPVIAAGHTDEFNKVSQDDSDVVMSDSMSSSSLLPTTEVFEHGVASGDPKSDRVILWTRVNPIFVKSDLPIEVEFQVSKDPYFSSIEQTGCMETSSNRDFSVKFDVSGLESDTHYHYRFIYRHQNFYSQSDTGRTKTLPDGPIDQVTLAIASCSHYGFGYFNVYARIAEMDDIDVVLRLGDYLYEYGNDDAYRNPFLWNRIVLPNHEMITLDDYRLRHATYKTDRDLQRLYRTHPMIAIWDDHEFTNNAWRGGAENHDDSEGDWDERAQAAIQAYYEWMPIREATANDVEGGDSLQEKSYREFRFGDLVSLSMIDTRYVGRDEQLAFDDEAMYHEQRSILGFDQEHWLTEQLSNAQNEHVRWKLIGQQVQIMQLKLPGLPIDFRSNYVNHDSWDGYPAARARLLNYLSQHGIDNVVFLTGDIHSSWAAAIAPDPYDIYKFNPFNQDGSVAVELVTPSVTSPTIPIPGIQQLVGDVAQLVRLFNPHIRYIDIKNRGFIKLTINHQELRADWCHVPIVGFRNHLMRINQSIVVDDGIPKVRRL